MKVIDIIASEPPKIPMPIDSDILTKYKWDIEKMAKWPPDNILRNSIDFVETEKKLTRFMKLNNFKMEELNYIYTMLNTFYYLNRPKHEKGQS